MRLLLSFLEDRNPFASDQTLRNLCTEVTAHFIVNADTAKDVGKDILQTMQSKPVKDFTFKRKDQVDSMVTKKKSLPKWRVKTHKSILNFSFSG